MGCCPARKSGMHILLQATETMRRCFPDCSSHDSVFPKNLDDTQIIAGRIASTVKKKNSQWFQWNLLVVYHWRNKHLWIIMNLWIFDVSCVELCNIWLSRKKLAHHWGTTVASQRRTAALEWSTTNRLAGSPAVEPGVEAKHPTQWGDHQIFMNQLIWRWVSVQMLKHWSESWWAEVLTDPKFQWHGKLT